MKLFGLLQNSQLIDANHRRTAFGWVFNCDAATADNYVAAEFVLRTKIRLKIASSERELICEYIYLDTCLS
ncbi:hypothetical protein A5635_21880 [Mycobacterium asiaticum]|uniref:Uncharacterized protein n=1 Tax=Mycobacterium asiaticum TaxID=1790 RepID=A0A1A3NKQ0_MYCAS|nr:hypothetical protein A5635_21880 [Mycobacterium asiaticum]